MLQNRVEEVQTLAYEIEDALDKFMAVMAQIQHHFHSNMFSQKLHEVAHYRTERNAKLEFSATKIKNVEMKISSFSGLDSLLEPPSYSTRHRDSLILHQVLAEEEIVGFKEPRERLTKQLMEADLRLLMILIVGPGGSGKTTVAKNVYESNKDHSISRDRLIRLWSAEGFITPGKGQTMEEAGESYLSEFIGRNLVRVTTREMDGRARSRRVLNLVREFIISKAGNFITVLEPNYSIHSGEKIWRLSVQNVNINLLKAKDLSHIRTLLVFGLASSPSEVEEVLKVSTVRFARCTFEELP
uniref:disease resistance protein RPM1-like n=1 Tax=Fragaria vesca subsp. vesca TaxID=101020 RepID=UPI0005C8102C|nr:PREDICTED: disease resistance protein RPM1-like [Fragaria vesca subsp. vesca]